MELLRLDTERLGLVDVIELLRLGAGLGAWERENCCPGMQTGGALNGSKVSKTDDALPKLANSAAGAATWNGSKEVEDEDAAGTENASNPSFTAKPSFTANPLELPSIVSPEVEKKTLFASGTNRSPVEAATVAEEGWNGSKTAV